MTDNKEYTDHEVPCDAAIHMYIVLRSNWFKYMYLRICLY